MCLSSGEARVWNASYARAVCCSREDRRIQPRPRLTRRFVEEFERYTRGPAAHEAPLQMAAHQPGPASEPMGK